MRAYYSLKYFILWNFRLALRRMRANSRRIAYACASHHGWDMRKRECLELVDSGSTEVFSDVGPDMSAGVKIDLLSAA
jgi:hypothetical protein